MNHENCHLVHDMPDADYRAAPGISQSALKHILDCPARYRWHLEHRTERREFDFGHAVHGELLGVGEPIEVLDFPDRRARGYKAAEEAAREAGTVPILSSQWDAVQAAAANVRAHPIAGPLLTRDGDSEASLFWTDEPTGASCKGRIDRVTVTPDGTHWLVDLKTIGRSAAPEKFGRHAADYGYHIQAAYYMDGYSHATGVDLDQIEWLNVIVESTAPHLVSVVTFDAEDQNVGRTRYRQALETLLACEKSGEWPGYTQDEVAEVHLPFYATQIGD